MLGRFSFEAMSEEGWKGELFLALYLLVSMVLILNLLIALLSIKYDELASHASGLYLQNIIDEQPRWAYHSRFNLFTFRVPILNVITFLSLPCLRKCSVGKRECIEKLQYLPAYLICLATVVTVDLVCIPLAWFKLVKRSI